LMVASVIANSASVPLAGCRIWRMSAMHEP
jgi:hypothetical protein